MPDALAAWVSERRAKTGRDHHRRRSPPGTDRGVRSRVARGLRGGTNRVGGAPGRLSVRDSAGAMAEPRALSAEPDRPGAGRHGGPARCLRPVAAGGGRGRALRPGAALAGVQTQFRAARQSPVRRVRPPGAGVGGAALGLRSMAAMDPPRDPDSRFADRCGAASGTTGGSPTTICSSSSRRRWTARAESRLAARIRHEYPCALVDEYQDTDPVQARIFTRVYGEAPVRAGRRGAGALGRLHRGGRSEAVHLPVPGRRRVRLSRGPAHRPRAAAPRAQLALHPRPRRVGERGVRGVGAVRDGRDRVPSR